MHRADSLRSRIATLVWWSGALAATALLALDLRTVDLSRLPPETPFDNTRSGHAEQWRFLSSAARIVPPGASFTLIAGDPDTEMSLYMMSRALLPQSTALPRSYYGRPLAGSDGARFVLSFGAAPEPGATTVVPGGFVTDRGAVGR